MPQQHATAGRSRCQVPVCRAVLSYQTRAAGSCPDLRPAGQLSSIEAKSWPRPQVGRLATKLTLIIRGYEQRIRCASGGSRTMNVAAAAALLDVAFPV